MNNDDDDMVAEVLQRAEDKEERLTTEQGRTMITSFDDDEEDHEDESSRRDSGSKSIRGKQQLATAAATRGRGGARGKRSAALAKKKMGTGSKDAPETAGTRQKRPASTIVRTRGSPTPKRRRKSVDEDGDDNVFGDGYDREKENDSKRLSDFELDSEEERDDRTRVEQRVGAANSRRSAQAATNKRERVGSTMDNRAMKGIRTDEDHSDWDDGVFATSTRTHLSPNITGKNINSNRKNRKDDNKAKNNKSTLFSDDDEDDDDDDADPVDVDHDDALTIQAAREADPKQQGESD